MDLFYGIKWNLNSITRHALRQSLCLSALSFVFASFVLCFIFPNKKLTHFFLTTFVFFSFFQLQNGEQKNVHDWNAAMNCMNWINRFAIGWEIVSIDRSQFLYSICIKRARNWPWMAEHWSAGDRTLRPEHILCDPVERNSIELVGSTASQARIRKWRIIRWTTSVCVCVIDGR